MGWSLTPITAVSVYISHNLLISLSQLLLKLMLDSGGARKVRLENKPDLSNMPSSVRRMSESRVECCVATFVAAAPAEVAPS